MSKMAQFHNFKSQQQLYNFKTQSTLFNEMLSLPEKIWCFWITYILCYESEFNKQDIKKIIKEEKDQNRKIIERYEFFVSRIIL